MRISVLPILLIFIFATIFCSLFLYSHPQSAYSFSSEMNEDDLGRVLGIDEAVVKRPLEKMAYNFYSLPENEEKFSVLPKKNIDYEELFIPDCRGVAIDNESDAILFVQDGDKQVPIASITKLATALVFLDQNIDWEKIYEVKTGDRVNGGKIYLYTGDKIKIKDLFYLSLVGSANTATMALVNSTGLSPEDFVALMNKKMGELGLKKTNFVDAIGLSDYNVSTAVEVARLAKAALSNQYISEATLTKRYDFSTVRGRSETVLNTDALLDIFPQNGIKIIGGKTGYTTSAGYCFVGRFMDSAGHEVISSILGGPNLKSRFDETKKLVEWVYDSYSW